MKSRDHIINLEHASLSYTQGYYLLIPNRYSVLGKIRNFTILAISVMPNMPFYVLIIFARKTLKPNEPS